MKGGLEGPTNTSEAQHNGFASPRAVAAPVQAEIAIPSKTGKDAEVNGHALSPGWGQPAADFDIEEGDDDFPSYDTAFVQPVKQSGMTPTSFAPVAEQFQLGSTNPVTPSLEWGDTGDDLFDDTVFGTSSAQGHWNEATPEIAPENTQSSTKDIDWGNTEHHDLNDPVFYAESVKDGSNPVATELSSTHIVGGHARYRLGKFRRRSI